MKGKLFFLITISVIVLSIGQLVISHSLATAGEKMALLEEKSEELEREITALTAQVGELGSLSVIAQEAKRLGMIESNGILSVPEDLPVALNQ